MKRIVKLVILFVVLTLLTWFIKKSMREGFSNMTAHLRFDGTASKYSSQKLTKISRVNVNGGYVYSKASIDVSNIIAMTVIDNNTVYLIDFSQKAYRVSFLLGRNEFVSMANNITPITLTSSQRVMKIVKSYQNDVNEVFFLSNHGNIYKQDGDTQIGDNMIKGNGTLSQPGIDFVDIATTGSLPDTMMGVTKEGRLLAINIETGAITHNVTSSVTSEDSYDADPSDDGNTFLYTQVEGNKDSSTPFPFVAIRTDTASPNYENSMVALQKSLLAGSSEIHQNLSLITDSHNDLLESSIKVHFHESDIFIYKLTSQGSVNKGAYKFKVGSAIHDNLFSSTNTNTLGFTVSNTGKAYHFTGNTLYSKEDPDDNLFINEVFNRTNSISTLGTSPTYVQLGAYSDDHIFLLMNSNVNVVLSTITRTSGSGSSYTKCEETYRNFYQVITNRTLQECEDICDQNEYCTSFSRPFGVDVNSNSVSVCLFSSNDQVSKKLNVYDTYFKNSSFSSLSGNVCTMFDSSSTSSVKK